MPNSLRASLTRFSAFLSVFTNFHNLLGFLISLLIDSRAPASTECTKQYSRGVTKETKQDISMKQKCQLSLHSVYKQCHAAVQSGKTSKVQQPVYLSNPSIPAKTEHQCETLSCSRIYRLLGDLPAMWQARHMASQWLLLRFSFDLTK